MNNIELAQELFEHIHANKIIEGLSEIINKHGVEALHAIDHFYGNDIRNKIFDLIDLDHDGHIIDTIPDIISNVFEKLTDLFSNS